MSSASRAGEDSGGDGGAPRGDETQGRSTSPGDADKEDRMSRRYVLDQAFQQFNTPQADDEGLPAIFNTGRKRLDWMINHRLLDAEDIVDRGVPADKRFKRFSLRPELLDLVDLVVSLTQDVLSSMASATMEDSSEEGPRWDFDARGILRENLGGGDTIAGLNLAWTAFNRRCSQALSVYRKYRTRIEKHIAGETPPPLSPLTTPGSVYRELPGMGDAEQQLRFLLGSVPGYDNGNREASALERRRFLEKPAESIAPPPSPLTRAFPMRLPERDPVTRYYDGEAMKDRPFGKAYETWSWLKQDSAGGSKLNTPAQHEEKKKGLKFVKQSKDDPSVREATSSSKKSKKKESESKNWRERDSPLQLGESISMFGSLASRKTRQQMLAVESASTGGGSKKKRTRSRRRKKEKGGRDQDDGKGGEKRSSESAKRGGDDHHDPAPHFKTQPGNGPPSDDDDDDDEDDDDDDSSSSEDDVVDLNEDDEPPLIPFGTVAPTVQSSIKPDQLPAWNGDKSTATEFLASVYEYANSGGYLNQAVGFWMWTRLERGSPVWQWYMTLSDSLKGYMKKSAHQFLGVIQRDYLGPKWIRDLATEYQFQSFREPRHRHETPSQFIYRRIIACRALAFAPMNSKEEVKMILGVAPPSWGIILVPSSIKSTDELSSRVLQFEEELTNASRSSGNDLKSQVAAVMKEIGYAASPSSRPRIFPKRSASVFDVEAEESGEAAEPPDEDRLAGDMLAVAYSVASARDKARPQPPRKYAPRNDVKSKKKPPSPCRPCGSPYHWNQDCPHWQEYQRDRVKEGFLVDTEDSEAERAYNVAYYLSGQGFEWAASEDRDESIEQEHKSQEETATEGDGQEGAGKASEKESVFVVTAQSFVSRIEEIEDDYWYEGELLPADSPYIIESIYEEGAEEPTRTGAVDEVYDAEWEAQPVEPTDRPPDDPSETPRPYEPWKVYLTPRIDKKKAEGVGSSVLSVRGHLGSEHEDEIDERLDSCASISLVSGETYDAMKDKPKLHQGAKMKLWQLTDKSVSIRGYVMMPVVVRMDDGTLVRMIVRMYVVEGMTVPVLLGEDFQQAYEVSVRRSLEEGTVVMFGNGQYTKTAQQASRDKEVRKEVQNVEKAYIGEKPTHSFLKKAARHRYQRAFKDKKKRADQEDHVIRAAEDVVIKPESVSKVKVSGPFDVEGDWIVEKEMIAATQDQPFVVPNTLVNASTPFVPVANLATVPRRIRVGEALGTAHRSEDFFDTPRTQEEYDQYRKHAAFLSTACAVKEDLEQRRSEPPKDEEPRPPVREKAKVRFHMPETQNYEAWKEGRRSFPMPDTKTYESWKNSFAKQREAEGEGDEDEEGGVGPKTAEMPDTRDITSEEFRRTLDVGVLPDHLKGAAWEMLERRKGAFALDGRLGNHPAMAKIRTEEGAEPIATPMRGSSPAKKAVMDEQIDKWFEQGVIEASRSPWSAPVVIAYRNGKPRFCVDYRRLNAVTIPDEFPIPRQQEILASLAGSQVLSSLDALSGFTQLRLDPSDIEKTAFRTHRGLFQFKRMPFGLRNGPSIFQRVMQSVLAPYLWLFALVYIDDIVVYSRSFEEHIEHLDKVLGAIEEANITLSPQKCHLFYDSIVLLGHKVSRLGLSTHYEKVKAVLEMKRPNTVSELQTFLGMLVYFNAFIPYYSDVCGPLHGLLRKGEPWRWGAEQEYAFLQAKKALQRAPVLGHPMEGRPYRLYTDASDNALGCALQQVQPMRVGDLKGTAAYEKLKEAHTKGQPVPRFVTRASNRTKDAPERDEWGATLDETTVHVERVIAYWSRTFKGAEARYSTTEREALAAKEGLIKFQPYLEGSSILLITDHSALQWARTYENSNRRLATWGAVFSSYMPGMEIIHRAGRVHSNVDPLSRIPRDPPPYVTPRPPATPPLRTDSATAALREEMRSREKAERAFVGMSLGSYVEDAPQAYAVQTRRSSRLARRGAEEAAAQEEKPPEVVPAQREEQSEADAQPQDEHHTPEEDEDDHELEQATQRPAYEPTFRKPPALVSHVSPEMAAKFKEAYQAEAYWRRRYEEADTVSSAWTPGRRYYKSDNGLLFFLDADYLPRLCVPDALRDEVLLRAHEDPMETAHAGLAKLWGKLHPRFIWRKMKSTIERFILTCDVCQKVKYASFSKYGTLIPNPIPASPYESISMDFVVKLPESEGYDAILVVVDRLTKHAQFIPTKTDINRIEAAKLFVKHVATRYGVPASIVSDQDPKWTSEFWEQVAKELKTDLLMSTAHHAQTDGQTEIVNRFMETMLRAYVAQDMSKWADFLPLLEFAYNATVHRSTGETPFNLLMGYHPRSPLSFWNNDDRLTQSAQRVPEAQKFLEEIRMRRDQARDAIAAAQDEQARYYNQGRKPVPEFKKGDKVLVNPHSLEWVEAKNKPKLRQRWIGPFEIQQRINPNVYRLRMDDRYPGLPIINFEHLKPYHEGRTSVEERRTKLPTTRPDQLPSDEYEVGQILQHRWNKRKRKREYLVRWKGYGPHYDTWQVEKDLRNAPDDLVAYKKEHRL